MVTKHETGVGLHTTKMSNIIIIVIDIVIIIIDIVIIIGMLVIIITNTIFIVTFGVIIAINITRWFTLSPSLLLT